MKHGGNERIRAAVELVRLLGPLPATKIAESIGGRGPGQLPYWAQQGWFVRLDDGTYALGYRALLAEGSDTHFALLKLCEGVRTLEDLSDLLDVSLEDTRKCITDLMRAGLVRGVSFELVPGVLTEGDLL